MLGDTRLSLNGNDVFSREMLTGLKPLRNGGLSDTADARQGGLRFSFDQSGLKRLEWGNVRLHNASYSKWNSLVNCQSKLCVYSYRNKFF